MNPVKRPRRNRRTAGLIALSQETRVARDGLILPLFVVEGQGRDEPIQSLPGVARRSVDRLAPWLATVRSPALLIFGVPDGANKDAKGSAALRDDGLVPQAVAAVRKERPDLTVITDVCLCSYTSHGHCGILTASGEVANDESLDALALVAVAHADAGAHMVAPSAMMDGQVAALRQALDAAGYGEAGIMSYAAKFASSFYGPFRDAAECAPRQGDRSGYQLPPANRREAIRDALLDEAEGADWLMVKPAMPYLDVLAELRRETHLPLAAYQVSGEYAMLKRAAEAGALDERRAALESILCIRRAGADAIVTYYAEDICRWVEESEL